MIKQHPVFEKFSPYSGPVHQDYQIDFIGSRMRCDFVENAAPSPPEVQMGPPSFDNEYFEWIDLLESVALARDRFTIMELGAGYGRWAVRAAMAARQRGLKPHLVAVEAEPIHFKWLQRHLCENGLDPADHNLVQAVVLDQPGKAHFYIGMPQGQDRADQWYGQALTKPVDGIPTGANRLYEGFPVFELKNGFKSIEVQAVTLGDLLRDLDRVDLIDMDVQGAELKIVRSTIDDLDRKVCRLHIGTHSREIDKGLKEALGSHGWICHFDFPWQSETETAFGLVSFDDGVQSWTNPRLQERGSASSRSGAIGPSSPSRRSG